VTPEKQSQIRSEWQQQQQQRPKPGPPNQIGRRIGGGQSETPNAIGLIKNEIGKLKKKIRPFQYKVTKQAFQSEETEDHLGLGFGREAPAVRCFLSVGGCRRAAISRQK